MHANRGVVRSFSLRTTPRLCARIALFFSESQSACVRVRPPSSAGSPAARHL